MEEEIRKIWEKIRDLEKRIAIFEGEPLKISPKKIAIAEFILSKKPKNDNEKTLAVGYYFEKYEQLQFFNVRDLEKGFREAKEKPPSNINDRVNTCVNRGFMHSVKEKKENRTAWTLTNSGISFVEGGFEKST